MDPDAQRILLSALTARRNGENKRVDLPGADLAGVHALAGDLVGARLTEADLEAACLAGARLSRARLEHADLAGADLDGADLTEADLRGADLSAASLDDAVLTRADLRGACLLGLVGDPLSMVGALIDKATIERSEFRMRDIAQLVVRGAIVDEKQAAELPPFSDELQDADEPPPSEVQSPGELRLLSLPPSSRGQARPSFVDSLRAQEVATRRQRVDQEAELPPSLRSFKELSALITEARTSESKPPSLRPPSLRPPSPSRVEVETFEAPRVGETVLGVVLEEELAAGTVARTFRGSDESGLQVVVKVFDPQRDGADIQLAAFQRGVRAMNRMQALDEPNMHVAELIAVSTDQTAYVVRHYANGSVEELVDVALTMQAGLDIFRSLCRTVAALNRNGTLLRSVKPSNILMDGLDPVISELDMVDLPTIAQLRGDLAGYGSYAAPEEIVGSGTRSPTADVFALGKVLEYLLTGHEPISPVGSMPIIADQKGVPPVLVEIVKRCIAQDPADRYQYVEDLLDDLQRFEREGASAVLNASIRPGALSRLKAGPSLAPAAPRPKKARAKAAAAAKAPARPEKWLDRRTELLVGGLGAACLLVGAALLYAAPASVDGLEVTGTVVAILGGLAIWLLPPPAERVRLFRVGSWAATAALISLVDPIHIAVLRWKHDLHGGDPTEKAIAVERLTRVGFRDFSGLDLSGIKLHNQDLSLADFSDTDLSGADLSRSFLQQSSFAGATLTEADVTSSDLRGAILEGARGVRRVDCGRLTKFPEGYYCWRGRVREQNATQVQAPGGAVKDTLTTPLGAD